MANNDLQSRLDQGPVMCAEGYIFELERRGYVQAGAFVPEVVLDNPEAVKMLHREFVRAGSDVVEALTYYGHREKLKIIGKEDLLERLQVEALQLAKDVADEFKDLKPLVAGNVCNTNVWDKNDPEGSRKAVRPMFEEQINWAKNAGVDFVIAETIGFLGEAEVALEVIKKAGLSAVVTLASYDSECTRDGIEYAEACHRLAEQGATVVGLNCTRGPQTMLALLEKIRGRVQNAHIGALPVPYRTTTDQPVFQSLKDHHCQCIPGNQPFPTALEPFTCNRYEIQEFAKAAQELDIRYVGLCCGAAPHHMRALAEAFGRDTLASKYTADMSKHYIFGSDQSLKNFNTGFRDKVART